MLELHPTCERCNKALPPDSTEARICSYEGGFVPRPIRPSRDLKGGNFLGKDPASAKVKHRPVDPKKHAEFAKPIQGIPPEKR